MTNNNASEMNPWPVSLMAKKLKEYIESLGSIWIEGEIVQWNIAAGNVYGKLKDLSEDVTVSFNIWSNYRNNQDFKAGDHVVLCVKPTYWLKGGTLSMQVSAIKAVGIGDLLERLERLRQQLYAEGVFDADRKKIIPFLPKVIGLVTGKDSDAEKDVIKNSVLRWPEVKFRTIHAAVQGDKVAKEVINALKTLDADPNVEVIIIARGGGDFQNLLGFSDEELIRFVASMKTPVVSAIGHEADRPLLDEVADLRASTPTDAAKRVVPDINEETYKIAEGRMRIRQSINKLLNFEMSKLSALKSRPVIAYPSLMLDSRAEDLIRNTARIHEIITFHVDSAVKETSFLKKQLHSLSPKATLERGYAIVESKNKIVTTVKDLSTNDTLQLNFIDGTSNVQVIATHTNA